MRPLDASGFKLHRAELRGAELRGPATERPPFAPQLGWRNQNYGRKSAPVPPKDPHEALARQLLQDLVRDEKARKGSGL
jgi:hypothetical protein